MQTALFVGSVISHLYKGDKKPADISVRLPIATDDIIYVSNDKTKKTVVGYLEPKTGLFVTDTKDIDDPQKHGVTKRFRDLAVEYAQAAVDKKLKELVELKDSDPEQYEARYKKIDIIEHELSDYLDDKRLFYTDLQKQVDLFAYMPLPHANDVLLYADDKLEDLAKKGLNSVVTGKLSYKNPDRQPVTDEQVELVEAFLDPFVDEYNRHVLSWYMGATLLNLPIYDSHVSKILIVSSSAGGSGKSTLFGALIDGLITPPFRDMSSNFDQFFRQDDRFGTSSLPSRRITLHHEAAFTTDTSKEATADFTGINQSDMKTLVTEGFVASEAKYGDKTVAKLTGMHVVLTNHPPIVDNVRTDLTRRLLACVIKPSRMVPDKSNVLGLHTPTALRDYIKQNAQAFANYFVDYFKKHQHEFTTMSYNTNNVIEDISESQTEYIRTKQVDDQTLKNEDALVIISTLAKRIDLDYQPLIKAITTARTANQRGDVVWDENYLYINSTKKFFTQYGVTALREELQNFLGETVKKFGKRMYRLEIK